MSGIVFTLEGADTLKKTLEAMQDGSGEAVMIPIVAAAAQDLKAIMAAMAPYRTGALARGISASFLKSGPGYAKFDVNLAPEVYYGIFQEFGLGDKRAGGVSKKTTRRHERGGRKPNMAAQPFIRPAIFGNRQQLVDQMIDGITAGVEEASGVRLAGDA